MKASDLREMTTEELQAQMAERQKDLVNFRLQQTTGVVDNNRAGRTARRDIARIKTVLRERELSGNQAQG